MRFKDFQGIDDSDLFYTIESPTCGYCKWLEDDGMGHYCKAFSKIPVEIWDGIETHTKPYKGDNGIQFEPIE